MYRNCLICFCLSLFVGCAEQSRDVSAPSPEPVTPVAFNAGGAPTVEFSVPDMMCPEGCGEKVKKTLAAQPGARDVRIDFEAKTATVAVEEEKFDAEQALAALVDHGFDHSTLNDAAAAGPHADNEAAVQ